MVYCPQNNHFTTIKVIFNQQSVSVNVIKVQMLQIKREI